MKPPNPSGIVFSDYRAALVDGAMVPCPSKGRGWVKGWALDCPTADVILVSKHCGAGLASPHNLVRFYNHNRTKTETRTIVELDSPDYPMGKRTRAQYALPAGKTLTEFRNGGDITICRLDEPFPKWVTPYAFSRRPAQGTLTLMHTPEGLSQGKLLPDVGPWLFTVNRDRDPVAGNSGLPWFIEDKGGWRVVGHHSKGGEGEGPCYAHPDIFKDLKRRIAALAAG